MGMFLNLWNSPILWRTESEGGQPGRAPGTGRGSNFQVRNLYDEESKRKDNEQEWLMVDQLVNAFPLTFVVSDKPLRPHTQISLDGLRAPGI